MNLTVTCLLVLVGAKTPQRVGFEFSFAEATQFMTNYGKSKGFTQKELENAVCSDIDYAISFEENPYDA